VRVDLGAGAHENPLAPVPGWGVELAPESHSGLGHVGTGLALGDLVDKAGAQLIVLRRTLEEATASDRVVRQHMADLTQRIQQGQRFGAEFDRRLAESGKAAGVLEKAAATLRGLESVVEQLRSSQGALEQRMQQRLNEQAESFASRLMELETTFESRLAEMRARCEEMTRGVMSEVDRANAETKQRAETVRAEIEGRADMMMAQVDRHAAQAQARVSLILDGASDRLATMEEQAERLGGASRERLDELCARAVQLLGHDPRESAGCGREPAPGSLAHAVEHARELIESVDDAGVRIGAIKSDASAAVERLEAARREVEGVIERMQPVQDELATKIEATLRQARESDETLRRASEQQRLATEAATSASERLSRQREDLEAIGAASAYHVSQAREAAASLGSRVEIAGERMKELDLAMERVSEQAQSMVELARRVAGLVEQAKTAE
jgi:chromosome segregation ATPase